MQNKQKLLALLAGIDIGDSPVTILLVGNGEIQIQEEGNMPTNYEFSEEEIHKVYDTLEDFMEYSWMDEKVSYEEYMANKGIDVIINVEKITSDAINKDHIFHNVQYFREFLSEVVPNAEITD